MLAATRLAPSLSRATRALAAAPAAGDLVTYERRGRVGVVTLNNPDKLNALSVDMGEQFEALMLSLRGEPMEGVGAVVLTGAGRAFSAGGDLEFLMDRHRDSPSRNAAVMRAFYRRFLSVRELPVPVVAAINGPAIGAGLCVALACDVRVADPAAKLGLTFVGIGLSPGMGCTHTLQRAVGWQVASRMLLTGEVLSGEEALRDGVVAAVSEPGAALDEAVALADRMAAQAPIAVRSCVRSLRQMQDLGLEQALWREADTQAQCYASDDLREGVTAVAEKRKPEFKAYESLAGVC